MNFIQRYQPVNSWVGELDRLFDRSLLHAERSQAPREVFHESEDSWILRLDLPGFAKEDLNLTLTDRALKLVAETSADRPFGGKVEREWKLGDAVDRSNIAARLENGVLELRLSKVTPVAPKAIQIDVE